MLHRCQWARLTSGDIVRVTSLSLACGLPKAMPFKNRAAVSRLNIASQSRSWNSKAANSAWAQRISARKHSSPWLSRAASPLRAAKGFLASTQHLSALRLRRATSTGGGSSRMESASLSDGRHRKMWIRKQSVFLVKLRRAETGIAGRCSVNGLRHLLCKERWVSPSLH